MKKITDYPEIELIGPQGRQTFTIISDDPVGVTYASSPPVQFNVNQGAASGGSSSILVKVYLRGRCLHLTIMRKQFQFSSRVMVSSPDIWRKQHFEDISN